MQPENPMIRWDSHGVPHSLIFRDKYFCTHNGYEESFYVSCQGNKLQERFMGLDPKAEGVFTIIETGFGTGLSFCIAWKLWKQCAPASWKLHFISIELYPLPSEDIAQALSLWPVLEEYKQKLLAQYHPASFGAVDFAVDGQQVRLTVIFEEVVKGLAMLENQNLAPNMADAWFLNGFSPFSNPLMWRKEVFEAMAKLSKPATTLSTFTVAGFVRRGLQENGFSVQRVMGYGKKKNILVGSYSK